ncbi:hypothetical protein COU61_00840 [Candidatus Pacearchaeota archaeon CG10_big_fil_rev_8_21_14_0_10_35_13]|nr:MAG: hypothetical protein COU61_00840 [Candidatus Pacearchaeota archaeon CG10_big_fil_rev_8_21_14_0_10_35_13]
MIWQDLVITITNLLFTYSLIPQVWEGFKIRKGLLTIQTSIITTIGLYAMSVVFLSLGLTFSFVISLINGTLWLILLLQRLSYGK